MPAVIYKNQVLVTSVSESEITSVDKFTGEKIFVKKINEKDIIANPWGGSALDDKNGIYYTVLGNPKPAHSGVDRPGENKNANSIIAFDIKTQKIIWSFQDVIHDLWNLDVSAPPILADIKIRDFIIQVIIVTTKSGHVYIFERISGKSLFDIDYKKTPISKMPNELASPYQPVPIKPNHFSRIDFKKMI